MLGRHFFQPFWTFATFRLARKQRLSEILRIGWSVLLMRFVTSTSDFEITCSLEITEILNLEQRESLTRTLPL